MTDEKKKILEMLEKGKIKVEEALELINAIDEKEEIVEPKKSKPGKAKFLRVRIDAGEKNGKEKARVNVNIPLSIAKKVSSLKGLIPKSAKAEMEKEGFNIDEIDISELIEAFENGEMDENLVDIDAGEGEDRAVVKVYVD